MTESESSLLQIFSCLRRVCYQSAIFGVSRYQYFNKIVEFYKSQDYQRLTDFYRYYEEYTKDHSCKEMLLNDRIHLGFITKTLNESNIYYPSIINELKTYGYDESVCSALDFVESICQDDNPDYLSAVSKANKCINDSKKKKAKNEYLLHRNMDSNLKSFLINYHGL